MILLTIFEVGENCFRTEIHLTDFVPRQNWQQAGIILSEDPEFKGKMLRISLGFNGFFGGFEQPPKIIIQVPGSSDPTG